MSEMGYLLTLILFTVVSVLYLGLSSIGKEKSITDKKEKSVLFLFGLLAVIFLLFVSQLTVNKEYRIKHNDQGECHDSTSKQYSH